MNTSRLAISEQERSRRALVDDLEARGAVGELVERLTDPSWVVRRAVVAALARLGDAAVDALCDVLRARRDDEARLAAAVDALAASRGDVEAKLDALAESADAAVVCDAAQVLGRRGSTRAVPLLARLSTHCDDNVALAALEALGRIGGDAAIEPLVHAVESRNFFRTFPAIDVLARTGDPRAVQAIVPLLDEQHFALEATRALGRCGDVSAVKPLAKALARPSEAHVRAAVLALVETRDRFEERFGSGGTIEEAVERAVESRLASRRMMQAYAASSGAEKDAICRVLGWIKDESAVATLVDLLDLEPPGSHAATDALAHLGPAAAGPVVAALRTGDSERRLRLLPLAPLTSAALPELLVCLDDPSAEVRAAACDALGRIGNPSAVRPLFAKLADPDPRVSQAVVAAIQSLGSDETEALAVAAAQSPDPRVRRAALRIVSYFGFASGLPILMTAMADADERVRDVATYGLPFVDDPRAVDALIEAARHTSSRTRGAAMRALGHTSREPRVLEALRAGLRDRDAWVRYYACQALSKLKDDASAERIALLLDDPAGQVRVAVVEALAQLRGERAVEALHKAAASSDPDVQRAALLGLAMVKRDESLPVLERAAAAPDAATRLVAIAGLAEYATSAVLPVLARAVSDADESVRSAAINLLTQRHEVEATQALVAQLGNEAVRERVVNALSRPSERRVEALRAALDTADAEIAPLVVAALARAHTRESAVAIADALASYNVHARRAAAAALAASPNEDTRPLLAHAAAHDADEDVRRVARAALERG